MTRGECSQCDPRTLGATCETGRVTALLSSLADRDRAHVWHPYASTTDPLPVLPVVAARGTRLTLEDGRELVDGMSSWWAAVHGYGHPVLDAALHEQVDRLGHVMFGGLTHAPAVELAELLVSLTPEPLTRVFFADSGSVAVEVALKMALQHWRGLGRPSRTKVLTVRGGYHGDTLGCMSVTDPVGGMHSLFADYVPQQLFAPPPRPAFDEPVDDADLADVARLLAEHPDQVACVIVEPVVQGAGGMRFYAPEYLRRLRALCDEHDVLLVLDEIATGFGRTGELFGADHAGVVGDIVCVGKALTGGYLSMAATLCTEAVADAVSACGALMHGPTFMANPLAAAMGLASTRLLLSRDWRGEVAAIGAGAAGGARPRARAAVRPRRPGARRDRRRRAARAGRPAGAAARAGRPRRVGPPVRPARLHDAAVRQHPRRRRDRDGRDRRRGARGLLGGPLGRQQHPVEAGLPQRPRHRGGGAVEQHLRARRQPAVGRQQGAQPDGVDLVDVGEVQDQPVGGRRHVGLHPGPQPGGGAVDEVAGQGDPEQAVGDEGLQVERRGAHGSPSAGCGRG